MKTSTATVKAATTTANTILLAGFQDNLHNLVAYQNVKPFWILLHQKMMEVAVLIRGTL